MNKEQIEKFIAEILTEIRKLNIDVANLELDHFGYQTSSAEDYDQRKIEAGMLGELASENIVGGRRVAIFRLKEPMQIAGYNISGFELVEPKEGQVVLSALEHVEFVLSEPLVDFMNRYPTVDWDASVIDREEFPKLQLKLTETLGLKFHPQNILDEIP